MDQGHIICPSISHLEEDCKKNIRCPVIGCGKILSQKQTLKFHIVKVHGIIKVLDFTMLLRGKVENLLI